MTDGNIMRPDEPPKRHRPAIVIGNGLVIAPLTMMKERAIVIHVTKFVNPLSTSTLTSPSTTTVKI